MHDNSRDKLEDSPAKNRITYKKDVQVGIGQIKASIFLDHCFGLNDKIGDGDHIPNPFL